MFETKDSGKRILFTSGMTRDTSEGKIDYTLVLDGPMFERWAALMTRGAQKYDARNWMKASGKAELERFRQSAFRHFIQWMNGDTDEDHGAAVMFNICGAEYVKEQLSPRRGIEWVAGMFEGEGTIILRKNRKRSILGVELSLSGTDEDTIQLFHASVDAGKVYGPYKYGANKKPFWKWSLTERSAVTTLLTQLLPLLGERRKARAQEALAAIEAREAEPHYRVSRKGVGGRKKKTA